MDYDETVWDRRYAADPDYCGTEPSDFARSALVVFQQTGVYMVADLGCGTGRDSLLFAEAGLEVTALDASNIAILTLQKRLADSHLLNAITPMRVDVRTGLPFSDEHLGAVYTFLGFDEGLSHQDLAALFDELDRITVPGAHLMVACRSQSDPAYGTGEAIEPDVYRQNELELRYWTREYVEELLDGRFELAICEEAVVQLAGRPLTLLEWDAVKP